MTLPRPEALQALCNQGLALHQAGRLDEARERYDAVLAVDPDHFDALHFLGVACIQEGQLRRGAELIERATRIKPLVATAHGNLANALNGLGRHDEAVVSCDRAIALTPDYAEAHGNRGLALYQLGRLEEALSSYAQAASLRPGQARAHYNQAVLLRELGRLDEALASFDRAIALEPTSAEAHGGRGVVLRERGRTQEALASFDQAIALRPDYAEAHYDRAIALRTLRRTEEALAGYEQAIALKPDYAEAISNRGNALAELQRYGEALISYERAIALKPDYAEAYRNRGVLLMDFRRLADAFADFDRAIALKPDYAEAHYNRAVGRLMAGDYAQGWAEYEWRWRAGQGGLARDLGAPLWLGAEDLNGRTILLHAEQGFGDVLQFCRYVPKVAALGARVVLEVYPGMDRLLARLEGVGEIVVRGGPLPPHDLQTPLASLPLALGAAAPDESPDAYLSADPQAAAALAKRLAGDGVSLRVGLCWAGGTRPDQAVADAVDRRRSLPLEAFAPLAGVEGVGFYSLQKGPPSAQLSEAVARGWSGPAIIDLTGELGDFADTAALVANLDLVITCDTAVAHLAGALGKPVWILNRYDACWRWLTDRTDSPWYPSARLIRQPAPGDWGGVVEAVREALRALAWA